MIRILLTRIYYGILSPSWFNIFLVFSAHATITFLGYFLLEPTFIASIVDKIYFYVVTTSTVGYGDMSPASDGGKLWTSIFVIPSGIIIITSIFGKILTSIDGHYENIKSGRVSYMHLKNHTLILGYVENETENIIEEIYAKTKNKATVVLVSEQENPKIQGVHFIKTKNISDATAVNMGGAKTAKNIIIMSENDEETFSACMRAYVYANIGTTKNLIAYFYDESYGNLLDFYTKDFKWLKNQMAPKLFENISL